MPRTASIVGKLTKRLWFNRYEAEFNAGDIRAAFAELVSSARLAEARARHRKRFSRSAATTGGKSPSSGNGSTGTERGDHLFLTNRA